MINKLKKEINAKLSHIQKYIRDNSVGNIVNIDKDDMLFLQGAETVLEDVKSFLRTGKFPDGNYTPEGDPEDGPD